MTENLDKLPIVEVVAKTFCTEYFLNGKMIQRKWLPQLFMEFIRSQMLHIKMRIKCRIGFWLLQSVREDCPYCHKPIRIGTWEKIFKNNNSES